MSWRECWLRYSGLIQTQQEGLRTVSQIIHSSLVEKPQKLSKEWILPFDEKQSHGDVSRLVKRVLEERKKRQNG